MMAARAGAEDVVCCEFNGLLAALSTELVDLNGFAGSVRVANARSTDLTLEMLGWEVNSPLLARLAV
jgi:hypothetical protein